MDEDLREFRRWAENAPTPELWRVHPYWVGRARRESSYFWGHVSVLEEEILTRISDLKGHRQLLEITRALDNFRHRSWREQLRRYLVARYGRNPDAGS